jgi:beta-glucan synthesis-associated protein KRE6
VSPFSTLGSGGQRGSMVLYRLAAEEDMGALLPPKLNNNRDSIASSSGDSIFSLSSDSKYPSGITYGGTRGLVPYAYDPAIDDQDPPDEEDMLHDPDGKGAKQNSTFLPWRGFLNVGVLLVLILGLLCLFIFYPVLTFIRNNARNLAIDGNIRINATGQAPKL